MLESGFFPQWPLALNALALFGLLLVAGIVGGELVQQLFRLPRLVGYVLIGLLLGGSGLNLITAQVIAESWMFVEIALGLVLFELGRRLHFAWLLNDRWLLATGVFESAMCFAAVFYALTIFGVKPIHAAVAAAIGVSTSPAVVLLVAQELKAEGQVTERVLNLTALNSVIAFVLTAMMISGIHQEYRADRMLAVMHPVYLIAGSLVLGYVSSVAVIMLSRWIGKHAERQLAVLLASIVTTVGAAHMLELSMLIALLALGVFSRNLDTRHDLMALEFSASAQMFYVVLFVMSGARLNVAGLLAGSLIAVVYVLARFAGKSIAVMSLTYFSGARAGSAGLLCLALMPMSGFALAMVLHTAPLYPEFSDQVSATVLSAVLLLELIGPVSVQYALRRAGEAKETS